MTIRYKKSGCISEYSIQVAVMDYLSFKPDVFPYVIHLPNEGKRSKFYGSQLKRLGMVKGASDLFIAIPRNPYHGAWIEIKAEDGRPSAEQVEFVQKMQIQGYFAQITFGLDNTLNVIDRYLHG